MERWEDEFKTVKPVINVRSSSELLQTPFSLRYYLFFTFFNFPPQRDLSSFSRVNGLPILLINLASHWHPTLHFPQKLWWESTQVVIPLTCSVFCHSSDTFHGLVQDVFIFQTFLLENCLWISVLAGALAIMYMDHTIRVEQLDLDFVPDPCTIALPWPLALAHLSIPTSLFLFCLHRDLCVLSLTLFVHHGIKILEVACKLFFSAK